MFFVRFSHTCTLCFKVSKQGKLTCQDYNDGASVKKHGIGKGLMTVWRATNPNGGDFPTGIPCVDREIIPQISTPVSRKPLGQQKKRRQLVSIMVSLVSTLYFLGFPPHNEKLCFFCILW